MACGHRVEATCMSQSHLPSPDATDGGVLHVPLPEPRSERALRLRALMSPERWQREVEKARWQLEVVKAVERSRSQGRGAQAATLRERAPDTHWSTFCGWRRSVGTRQGPEWERLLDGRVPPPAKPVPEKVKAAAVILRRVDPHIRYEEARDHLKAQFQEEGEISDSTLGRLWRAHGLGNPDMGDPRRFERVVHYSGGAALALVGAAAAESGVPEALARAVQEMGMARVAEQGEEERPSADPVPGRDELGRFTAEYNQAARQGLDAGQRDPRWDSDAAKRDRRELASLSILSLAPETLGQRLLTMGMVPLVSSQRGFDGMDAPRASWLKMLGWPAYRPPPWTRAWPRWASWAWKPRSGKPTVSAGHKKPGIGPKEGRVGCRSCATWTSPETLIGPGTLPRVGKCRGPGGFSPACRERC